MFVVWLFLVLGDAIGHFSAPLKQMTGDMDSFNHSSDNKVTSIDLFPVKMVIVQSFILYFSHQILV